MHISSRVEDNACLPSVESYSVINMFFSTSALKIISIHFMAPNDDANFNDVMNMNSKTFAKTIFRRRGKFSSLKLHSLLPTAAIVSAALNSFSL